MRPLVPDPLMRRFWPLVVERWRHTDRLGYCLAQARHQFEGRWGLRDAGGPSELGLPVASRSAGSSFICWPSPRFREVHNGAVEEYRRSIGSAARRIRCPTWPRTVPGSSRRCGSGRPSAPQRRRLFVRRTAARLMISDRQGLEFRCPWGRRRRRPRPSRHWPTGAAGACKIRSRALVTTLWARLALGDLFLHGIGGREVRPSDRPPDRAVLRPPAARHHGPVGHALLARGRAAGAAPTRPAAIRRALRDLVFHPELASDPPRPPGGPASWWPPSGGGSTRPKLPRTPSSGGDRSAKSTRPSSRGWPSTGDGFSIGRPQAHAHLRAAAGPRHGASMASACIPKKLCGNSWSDYFPKTRERVLISTGNRTIRRCIFADTRQAVTLAGFGRIARNGRKDSCRWAERLVGLPTGSSASGGGGGCVRRFATATASDHAAIACFLGEVFGEPAAAELKASLEDPFYEPHDRLLLRRAGRIIAHVHLTHRVMQFGRRQIPVAGLDWLAIGPLPRAGLGHTPAGGRRAADGPLGRPGRPAADAACPISSAAPAGPSAGRPAPASPAPMPCCRGCWIAGCARAVTRGCTSAPGGGGKSGA